MNSVISLSYTHLVTKAVWTDQKGIHSRHLPHSVIMFTQLITEIGMYLTKCQNKFYFLKYIWLQDFRKDMWSCRVFLSSLHSQYEETDCVWEMEVKKTWWSGTIQRVVTLASSGDSRSYTLPKAWCLRLLSVASPEHGGINSPSPSSPALL